MPGLNFESMTKEFLQLAGDRYPSPDKVLQAGDRLIAPMSPGDPLSIQAKIIVLSRFRDACREVASNQIFRSIQHRDELYNTIVEALEGLEDAWEDHLAGLQEAG